MRYFLVGSSIPATQFAIHSRRDKHLAVRRESESLERALVALARMPALLTDHVPDFNLAWMIDGGHVEPGEGDGLPIRGSGNQCQMFRSARGRLQAGLAHPRGAVANFHNAVVIPENQQIVTHECHMVTGDAVISHDRAPRSGGYVPQNEG